MEDPSEDALRTWLKEAYCNRGFDSYDWHENERRNENGVDVDFTKTGCKIAMQVKISPVKKDIPQMEKLARAEGNERIYIYWNLPTKEFQEKTKETDIKTFTHDELVRLLIESRSIGFLTWYFGQNPAVQNMIECFATFYECAQIPSRAYQKQDIGYAWRLKSSSVKAKTDIEFIKNYLAKTLAGQTTNDRAIELTEQAFVMISVMKQDTYELLQIVKTVQKEAPHLLRLLVDYAGPRTTWINLHSSVKNASAEETKNTISNWLLVEEHTSAFTSVFTWLIWTLDSLYDKLGMVSQFVDSIFGPETIQKL
jgi:hypothetical protein